MKRAEIIQIGLKLLQEREWFPVTEGSICQLHPE